jgi:4-amino-4-deoxy-L-arabinose transferase-like glycosyltransferase
MPKPTSRVVASKGTRRARPRKGPTKAGNSAAPERLALTPDVRTSTAVIVIVLILGALWLPFVGRAFHIDDPLFIWAAKHIQTHPWDPFGFSVNWYGGDMPMAEVTNNPPLTCYYLAAVGSIAGWSEVTLHLAMFLPGLAAALGMFVLARRFCGHPLIATCAGILTPVFAVSGVTVMSDMTMLAFWIFAVVLWLKGLETRSHALLASAGVLIALAALAKYFAIALIPLLLGYALLKERRVGWWMVHLLIPVLVVAAYEATTRHLYGHGLLFVAARVATEADTGFGKFNLVKLLVNTAFAGGCVASVLFFTMRLWRPQTWLVGVLVAAGLAWAIASSPMLGFFQLPASDGARWTLAIQVGVWAIAGAGLLTLGIADVRRHRNAESLLLAAWLIGTYLFAGFVNWSTNGRSILPMIVPAGILIARRLEERPQVGRGRFAPGVVVPLAAAAILSFAVVRSDSAFADAARAGASLISQKYADASRTIWFQGHWGYQYYMEQLGAKPMDVTRWSLANKANATPWSLTPGDVVAFPTNNTNFYSIPPEWITVRDVIDLPSSEWLATANKVVGAGFYGDRHGPLPFALGSVAPERFYVLDVRTADPRK